MRRRKPAWVCEAFDRGVLPVRRLITPESVSVVAGLIENLEPEIVNAGRPFAPHTIGATVVAFSAFDKRHRYDGPRTIDIAHTIDTAGQPLKATIGRLMVAGSGYKLKLAAELVSPDLLEERELYSQAFEKKGFPLCEDFNAPDGEYTPHLSIALLYNEHVSHFQNFTSLKRLSAIGSAVGEKILLASAAICSKQPAPAWVE